jgi:hypothetical protein
MTPGNRFSEFYRTFGFSKVQRYFISVLRHCSYIAGG